MDFIARKIFYRWVGDQPGLLLAYMGPFLFFSVPRKEIHPSISLQEFSYPFFGLANSDVVVWLDLMPSFLVLSLSVIIQVLVILLMMVIVILMVAFTTLAERKIMASMQRRKGPNVVGFRGWLQPLADAFKLLFKETVLPGESNRFLFFLAPVFTLLLSLASWAVIPYAPGKVMVDLNLGILYLFAISSLGVYGVIGSGWSSNSRYAFLGGLRSTAQMISYEVSIGLVLMGALLFTGSLNLTRLVYFQSYVWLIFPCWPLFVLFLISALAETNRPPFDLPEAEAELVSGYNVEYSAAGFALFFLAEYANIILMSTLSVLVFFGGWLVPFLGYYDLVWFQPIAFGLKVILVIFFFVWVRVSLPRYRYDQLMRLGWKVFLPLSLGYLLFMAGILFAFDGLPPLRF